jgi:hypothetical protein
LIREQPRNLECRDPSERQSNDCDPQSTSQNEPQNLSALGSQRHADSDFLRPLRDAVVDHAVQAERGQKDWLSMQTVQPAPP